MLVTYAECLPRNVPFHLILNKAAIHYRQARRPGKLYFVKIMLVDLFYSHVFEIFVSER